LGQGDVVDDPVQLSVAASVEMLPIAAAELAREGADGRLRSSCGA
jgi:hypothetical protein